MLIGYHWPNRDNNRIWLQRSKIVMLCYLIYVKKYENIFYKIVRAKLEI